MQVGSVHVYPVKSGRGVELPGSVVERCGLAHDRRWMVTHPDGRKLTGRKVPRLLVIGAAPDAAGGVVLTADGVEPLSVPVPVGDSTLDGQGVAVGISRLSRAAAAGATADRWVSTVLERPARLVWLDDPARRPVATDHGGRVGDPLSLADAGPVLLTTEASLRRLQEWVGEAPDTRTGAGPDPLSMARFRPNVVVGGDLEPFVEDTWTRVRIGALEYRFAEHCDRCVMTTYNPDTLVRGHEPLRALAKHRHHEGKVWFGIRLIPLAVGRIEVGDRLEVLEAGGRLP